MAAFASALPGSTSRAQRHASYKGRSSVPASVTPDAAEAGSANTVVVQGGHLVGLSTDGDGVLVPLRSASTLQGALSRSSGGRRRAGAAFASSGGAYVTVLARRADQAAEVAAATGCSSAGLEALPGLRWTYS